MAKGLDDALALLLKSEGGWSNNPSDTGGATFNGVTQAVYDGWRDTTKQVRQSVRKATSDEIKSLYRALYWEKGSHLLPWPISYLCFDASVNSGPSRGVRWVQAGLGQSQDGAVGPATVRAANQVVQSGMPKLF